VNYASPSQDDPHVLPEHTKELCQLRWLDEALSPLNFLEHGWRFVVRRLKGLRRRFWVAMTKLHLADRDVYGRPRSRAAGAAAWDRQSFGMSDAGAGDEPGGAPSESHDAHADSSPKARRPRGGRGLRAGDLVEVLSKDEIKETLDKHGKRGGLKFLPPMLVYCRRRYRVLKPVRYILDEHEHQMRKVKNVVLLDGVICVGKGIYGREDCDRSCFFFWKEAWLRKIEED